MTLDEIKFGVGCIDPTPKETYIPVFCAFAVSGNAAVSANAGG